MATAFHVEHESKINQSDSIAEGYKFGIVVSEWNSNITASLCEGAVATLLEHGVDEKDITVKFVPGSFELTFGAAAFINQGEVDAVIVLGSVVRGETPHFDYVCQGVTQGIAQLNAMGDIPVIFGVLTTDNMEQAEERAGGKLGNKGSECAETAIKMINFACSLKK
jgi:6,7-dimethyl-8-ribityllumazine synthase